MRPTLRVTAIFRAGPHVTASSGTHARLTNRRLKRSREATAMARSAAQPPFPRLFLWGKGGEQGGIGGQPQRAAACFLGRQRED